MTQKNPSSKSILEAKKTIDKQINWWIVIGISLPLSFLAFLFFVNLFGHDTIYDVALTVGGTVFATIGFIWWWWAIYTIAKLTLILGDTSEKFDKVTGEFKEIRKDINSLKQ